ncbi:MAG: hypothetical protein LBR92_04650 [Puniceicoccales bacterium]|jgi:hypothetical protein|nr:hypothetical protein [Puniceicoccales bacterium]
MVNKIITNVVLGSTLLGGGMIGLTTHPLAAAQPLKEQPKYDNKATERLRVLRWTRNFKKCMEFLKGEGKNADPNVSVDKCRWDSDTDGNTFYQGITLLEEAILHRSLEDVRMLVSNRNVWGIDLGEQEFDPTYSYLRNEPKCSHTLMHTAVASPEEMEMRWNIQFRAIKAGMKTYAHLVDEYSDLIKKEGPNPEDYKPSDLHASAEIVQFLIDVFKERKKGWVLKVHKRRPRFNSHKSTTPLDLVKDYLNPRNVENYRRKKKENYEKHKEEYMRIEKLLKETQNE